MRSTKTVTASFSYINWASWKFDQVDLALCSKTIGTCLRNVVRPLRKILAEEPNYEVKEHRASAEGYRLDITETSLGHTNSFYVYGGKDESSQDLVQGKTLAGAFMDEALLYPLSFINQVLSRLSVDGATAWFTFNPEAPTHEAYETILDPYVADGRAFYLHLTMDDNPSLSQETKDRISSQWPVGSVWHRRNVLGLRVAAEGAIYPFFTSDFKDGYVISELPTDLSRWRIAIDYGQDHPTTMGLYGHSNQLNSWILVNEYYAKMKTNEQLSVDFSSKMLRWDNRDIFPECVDIDTGGGGLALLNQLRQDYPALYADGIIRHAIKQNVNKEISQFASALFMHKFRYYAGCKQSIQETANYLWAKKPVGSGKEEPLKVNDDGPDRDRYFWNRVLHSGG